MFFLSLGTHETIKNFLLARFGVCYPRRWEKPHLRQASSTFNLWGKAFTLEIEEN